MSSQPKVYLITSCSSGLGLELACAALLAGHKVIATSRNPPKTPNVLLDIQSCGGHWAELDVTASNLDEQFQGLVKVYGRIDVLINNAGFAIGNTVENTNLDLARKLFETNFFRVVQLCQLCIPIMRKQSGGTIVNISSGVTVHPVPMVSIYAASKCAIDGFIESLRGEVAVFGIRVLLAQPRDMKTSFKENAPVMDVPEVYKGTPTEMVINYLMSTRGKEAIDPRRSAKRIVEVVDGTGMAEDLNTEENFRIPLGSEIQGSIQGRIEELKRVIEVYDKVCESVDF